MPNLSAEMVVGAYMMSSIIQELSSVAEVVWSEDEGKVKIYQYMGPEDTRSRDMIELSAEDALELLKFLLAHKTVLEKCHGR